MLEAPHFACASKARHNLIQDQEDTVLVTDGADALNIAYWRNEDATRTHDRLEHYGGDRFGTLG